MNRLGRACWVFALALVALLVLSPAAAFGVSVSWATVDGVGIGGQPHYVWPYVAWSHPSAGTQIVDLRDGTLTTEVTTGTPQPFLSEDMVGWWNGTTWSARFFESGETTQIPVALYPDRGLLASGTRVAQFSFNPRVYDCATGSLVSTLGPGNNARAALEGDRLIWSSPKDLGSVIRVWDFVADTSLIATTTARGIVAMAAQGDRVVFAIPADAPGYSAGSAIYLLNLSTGTSTMLCTARSWPMQMHIFGDYVYFDGYGVRVFNLRTGVQSQALLSNGSWSGWEDHIVFNRGGQILFGTPDTAPPVTVSDARANYLSQASVRLSVVDDISPAETCRTFWRLDGSAAVESTVAVTAESGDHTLEFWSLDEMGNEEAHQSVTFTVEPVFTITAIAGAHGAISDPGVTTYGAGDDCTYTITPAVGYRILDVVVDGVSVGPVGSYVFSDVRSEHTIAATFALPQANAGTPIAPSTMYKGRAATIYGYVSPKHSSGTYLVTLKFYKRNSSGAYVYHHSVKAKRYYYSSSKTKYKAYTSLPHSGRWRVRAYHSCDRHSGSYSGYDYITVK